MLWLKFHLEAVFASDFVNASIKQLPSHPMHARDSLSQSNDTDL